MSNIQINMAFPMPAGPSQVEAFKPKDDVPRSQDISQAKENKFDDAIKSYALKDKGTNDVLPKKKIESLEKSKNVLAAKKSSTKENTVDQDEKDSKDNMETVVTNMILETLNITPEQLNKTLEQMQISALDLLDGNVFREFIMQLQDGSMTDMLMQSDSIKNIGKLFEKLEQIGEVLQGEDENSLSQTIGANTQISPSATQILENQGSTLPNVDKTIEQLLKENTQPVVGTIKTDTKEESKASDATQEGVKLDNGVHKGEFVLQMPIQPLESNITTQLWNRGTETLQKTLLSKENNIENQILQKIEINALKQGKEIQMELNPRELGKVALRITENSGIVTANIRVESEKTKEMLMQNIEQLKEGLQKQGLSIGELNVDVRRDSHQSEMQKQRQKSSKRIEEIIAKHLEEMEDPEATQSVVSETEIDYMA